MLALRRFASGASGTANILSVVEPGHVLQGRILPFTFLLAEYCFNCLAHLGCVPLFSISTKNILNTPLGPQKMMQTNEAHVNNVMVSALKKLKVQPFHATGLFLYARKQKPSENL